MAEEKCVKQITGYDLKDSEAREQIEDLEIRLGITNREREVTNNG